MGWGLWIAYGQADILNFLGELGVDFNIANSIGKMPVHLAAAAGHVHALATLKQYGADLEAGDANGQTPLLLAIEMKQLAVLRWLLEQGVDVDTSDGTGKTPLYLAVATGEKESVQLLLHYAADIDQDVSGSTPLLEAMNQSDVEMVALLISYGAEISDPVMEEINTQVSHDPNIVSLIKRADQYPVDDFYESFYKNLTDLSDQDVWQDSEAYWGEYFKRLGGVKVSVSVWCICGARRY